MTAVFQGILEMSFQASFIIGLVILIRLILKRMPRKHMCILWLAVLVRLLCPFTFPVELGFLQEADTGWVQEPALSSRKLEESIGTEDALPEQWENGAYTSDSFADGSREKIVGNERAFFRVIGFAWILGAFLMLIWNGAASLKLWKKIQRNRHQEGPGIWSVEGLETPFVMGFLRPQIYLPASLSGEERSFILLHEKAHIQRKDPILKFAGFAALCIHWFNPLVWAAFYFMSADMEMACDERVLDKMGAGVREAYSTTLLRLSVDNPVFSGLASGFGEVDPKKRIRHILNYRKLSMHRVILIVSLLVLVAAGMLLSPRAGTEGDRALAAEPGEQAGGPQAQSSEAEKEADKPEEPNQEELPAKMNEAQDETEAETHLKLTELKDYAPYYVMSFQKIEGGTGERLSFEGNTVLADQEIVGPDRVEVEPQSAIWELGFHFDGKENLADTITLEFWNRGGSEAFQVILDGLIYEVAVPKVETKEVEIGEKLPGTQVMVEDACIYPHALFLRLSGIDSGNWDNHFYLIRVSNGEEEKISPVRSAYEETRGEMHLLFLFKEGIPEEKLTFRMGEDAETGMPADRVYYNLDLEEIAV